MIDTVIIEGVRCFKGRTELPIRPLTLLVGENSSGKTTALSLVRAAWELNQAPLAPNFNEEPFLLGAYEQLAHYHGGQGKRAAHFTIGSKVMVARQGDDGVRHEIPVTVSSRFIARGSQPWLQEWVLETADVRLCITDDQVAAHRKVRFRSPTREVSFPVPRLADLPKTFLSDLVQLAVLGSPGAANGDGTDASSPTPDEFRVMVQLERAVADSSGPRPVAWAPVRSKPRRTYDPVRDTQEPDGGHVPMVLANLAAAGGDSWEHMREQLRAFGKGAGLLSDIEVKRKGSKESDPFQVEVGMAKGIAFNLVDVGYGVSQALPILVDTVLASPGACFLLQQPEVHLHPRAQAQLGSFLGASVKDGGKRFVVETHSDYLLDRVRMDVRDGSGVRPEDVVILFFERKQKDVIIHEIGIDAAGNLIGAPPSYRTFFLTETRRLLEG